MGSQQSFGLARAGASSLALAMIGVSKRYGAVVALDDAHLEVARGEVHALLGENGAGKTTLMNIAAGVIRPDSGEILVQGERLHARSPRDAMQRGIGIVPQHFRLVDNFTVAENIHLGWSETPRLISTSEMEKRTRELSGRFGFDVRPGTAVWQLSVGEMQRVAILRALARGAEILILDEPTSVLTPQESSALFSNIADLVDEGRTVVFISHKLREVLDIADRISVLRAGRPVGTVKPSDVDARSLARLMVGREVAEPVSRSGRSTGTEVIAAKDVSALDDRALPALRRVNVSVRAGEIVGVAGVSGNGQKELAEVLAGTRPLLEGTVHIRGREMADPTTRGFIREGVGHVPEDVRIGLALGQTVEANAVMKAVDRPPVRRGLLLSRRAMRAFATNILQAAGLNAVDLTRRAETLSGGQAQRLIVRRELGAARAVLIAAYPTRGLDVAGVRAIHEALVEASARSVGVLMISEDLDELFQLCDRVIVLYEGQVVGDLAQGDFDRGQIGLLMAGITDKMNSEPYAESDATQ